MGILHHGKLIAEDRPSELIRAAGVEPRLELRLSGDVEAAKRALGEDAPWSGEPDDDGRAEVAVRAPDGWRSAQDVTERLAREGVTVEESRLRDATLEDAFIKLTGSRLEGPFESV